MKKPLTIKNFTDDFSLVTDAEDTPYAYNHKKYGFFSQNDEDLELDLHPISDDGIVDYKTVVTITRNKLTPRFAKIIPRE